jgi:hypothetical protein
MFVCIFLNQELNPDFLPHLKEDILHEGGAATVDAANH